jgi:hypothetical protein
MRLTDEDLDKLQAAFTALHDAYLLAPVVYGAESTPEQAMALGLIRGHVDKANRLTTEVADAIVKRGRAADAADGA